MAQKKKSSIVDESQVNNFDEASLGDVFSFLEKSYKEILKHLSELAKKYGEANIKEEADLRKKYEKELEELKEVEGLKSMNNYYKQKALKEKEISKYGFKTIEEEKKAWEDIIELRKKALLSKDEKESKLKELNNTIEGYKKQLDSLKTSKNEELKKQLEEKLKAALKENADLKKTKKELEDETYELEKRLSEKPSSIFQKIEEKATSKSVAQQGYDQLETSLKSMAKTINEGLNKINNAVDTYVGYQLGINTRLQGTGYTFSNVSNKLDAVSVSPLIKTETLYANLSQLVAEGIASNVEQRAFLQTVKDGIATTFDANNGALKRIIRLQQQDSTAARLGLEAFLTTYLNALTSNTEYLQSTFDSVAESLVEASSLLTMQESTEFEYVVQKWLGAYTGLGLSENTAQSIGQAIGYLGSGNVSALSGNALQNLLVMGASNSGLSYSSLLSGGLDADTTNRLMYGIFSYLSSLSDNSNNVVKSELARTYGVSVSDLVAARNMGKDELENMYNVLLTYGDMYKVLGNSMNTVQDRLGIGGVLSNLFSNLTFGTGVDIAENPVLQATWKITDLIQTATGGINIPFISAFGNGFDLNTTVEGLMKLGIAGIGFLGNIGQLVSGVAASSSSGEGYGQYLLNQLGIGATSSSNVIARGTGLNSSATGVATSISTFVGNTSGEDYSTNAITSEQDKYQEEIDQKTSEETNTEKLLKSSNETTNDMLIVTKEMRDYIKNNSIKVSLELTDFSGLNTALPVSSSY